MLGGISIEWKGLITLVSAWIMKVEFKCYKGIDHAQQAVGCVFHIDWPENALIDPLLNQIHQRAHVRAPMCAHNLVK